MPTRQAEATWNGNLKEGNGTMKIGQSGEDQPYSFASRFKEGEGSNPEELIGAALAGCYSMALSNILDQAGYPSDSVKTEADVELDMSGDAPRISTISLNVSASVPDTDDSTFQEYAGEAKKNCPVSRALTGVDIRLNATLNR